MVTIVLLVRKDTDKCQFRRRNRTRHLDMKFVRTKDKADLCSLVVIVVVAVEHVG